MNLIYTVRFVEGKEKKLQEIKNVEPRKIKIIHGYNGPTLIEYIESKVF